MNTFESVTSKEADVPDLFKVMRKARKRKKNYGK